MATEQDLRKHLTTCQFGAKKCDTCKQTLNEPHNCVQALLRAMEEKDAIIATQKKEINRLKGKPEEKKAEPAVVRNPVTGLYEAA